jgi:hypothetical protein
MVMSVEIPRQPATANKCPVMIKIRRSVAIEIAICVVAEGRSMLMLMLTDQ